MRSIHEIHTELENLFKSLTGKHPESCVPLPESGSARKYYRLKAGDIQYIGTYNPIKAENIAFFSFSDHFSAIGLPVPKVLKINHNEDCYLQTDFGDTSLFHYVQQSHSESTIPEKIIGYYEDAISYLVDFQISGHKGLNYQLAYPVESFNEKAILDDLYYFKYYFLKLHPQIVFDDAKLDEDFSVLTGFIRQAPSDYFMYRDFQSRNIIIHNDRPYFIDFQGGRRGPLQYDVASLLFQVKAQLPTEMRHHLLKHYLFKLAQHTDPQTIAFEKFFPAFVYLRLFQVLGAYGFRGLIQKKRHFIESIPYALREIEQQLNIMPLPLSLPELKGILLQLAHIKNTYPIEEKAHSDQLQLIVSSFSYLKGGIPDDGSGNGGGFVFDCRSLPNPGRETRYKMLTGRDQPVKEFLEGRPEVADFLDQTEGLVSHAVQNYLSRGFKHLMVSFGCTGGQHRSVYCADFMAGKLKQKFPEIAVRILHHEQQFKHDEKEM
jgi:aminoglycoside/choline kinase family phosphotransferase